MLSDLCALRVTKLVHTLAWAFIAGCIVAIPLLAWADHFRYATICSIVVALEVLVLVVNGWKCPLTAVASRYTSDRRDNFDIYLPEWLARYNKVIFGALYFAGLVFLRVVVSRCASGHHAIGKHIQFFKPGAAYFGLVFGAGFLLGCIRVPFLVPRLGERVAELLEMPFQFVVIVLAARFVVRRFSLPATTAVRLGVGLVALGLALAAELLLALAMSGKSVGEYIASRDPVSGSVYLLMLLLFALLPMMLGRRQAIPK